ncbi:hypothetical protein PIB30_095519 [Stylosanthes scabra]|uniref:Uncharacterized protein n=1 Tax=Stylosanthes scabra TaxID=79078 RepID=A0ABU6RW25_9FABA|nr:hypothetical protein [Stylosanthes scabra]
MLLTASHKSSNMSSNNIDNSGKQNTKGAVNSSGFTFGRGNNPMFCNCVKLPGGALCGVENSNGVENKGLPSYDFQRLPSGAGSGLCSNNVNDREEVVEKMAKANREGMRRAEEVVEKRGQRQIVLVREGKMRILNDEGGHYNVGVALQVHPPPFPSFERRSSPSLKSSLHPSF